MINNMYMEDNLGGGGVAYMLHSSNVSFQAEVYH